MTVHSRKNFKCSYCEIYSATTDQRAKHEAQRHPTGAVWHGGDCTTRENHASPSWNRYVITCDQHSIQKTYVNNKREARALVASDFCEWCQT